ncbi:MAG: methyltransferase domain-containing protein [Planctomycetaceae bacterium]|nr:methyltransferase domain-containing protein [Planctomycetaceae bacterium]
MKWQTKAYILRQLSQLPMGKQLYLLLQKMAGSNRPLPNRDFARINELLDMIQQAGQTAQQATFFEIGSGWHPYAPLGCYLAGAEKIITVDVNPWMTLKSAKQCIAAAKDHLPEMAHLMGIKESLITKRYQKIDQNALRLDLLLKSMNTEYRYPADASDTKQEDHSIDFVISSNVLEHIPLQILKSISTESMRILKPGGLAVHRFNPGDHYANHDQSITTANFLQYPEQDWKPYNESLAYHNRLRSSQYSQLFNEAGFTSLIEETHIDTDALEALQQKFIQPDSMFSQFSTEDLATDYMWYMGIKPTALSEIGQCDNMRTPKNQIDSNK